MLCLARQNILAHFSCAGRSVVPNIPLLRKIITQSSALATFFNKSTRAATLLRALFEKHHITRGIQSISKTRFSTSYTSATSVKRCLPAIRELYETKAIVLPKSSVGDLGKLVSNTREGREFANGLEASSNT